MFNRKPPSNADLLKHGSLAEIKSAIDILEKNPKIMDLLAPQWRKLHGYNGQKIPTGDELLQHLKRIYPLIEGESHKVAKEPGCGGLQGINGIGKRFLLNAKTFLRNFDQASQEDFVENVSCLSLGLTALNRYNYHIKGEHFFLLVDNLIEGNRRILRVIREGLHNEIDKNFIDEKGSRFFRKLREHDLEDVFLDSFDDRDCVWPGKLKPAFLKWRTRNPLPVINDPDETVEILNAGSPPVTISPIDPGAVEIVPMDRELVEQGEPDELLATVHSPDKQPGSGPERQDRAQWIIASLLDDGLKPIPPATKAIRHYSAQELEAKGTKYPYEVIDIDGEINGRAVRAQIFVCNYNGYATFTARNPYPIDPLIPIRISTLREDNSVFLAVRQSHDQWLGKIRRDLHTPLDQLEPELKHMIAWGDKKHSLRNSFIAYMIREGKIPRSVDNSIIEHGPLTGCSTWRRGYNALRGGQIRGLNARTYHGLYNDLILEIPVLKSFLGEEPIEASSIVTDLRRAFAQGVIPETANLEKLDEQGVKIAGRSVRAFKFGAVRGVQSFVAEKPTTSLEDFEINAGLAKRGSNGDLIANISLAL